MKFMEWNLFPFNFSLNIMKMKSTVITQDYLQVLCALLFSDVVDIIKTDYHFIFQQTFNLSAFKEIKQQTRNKIYQTIVST